MASLQNIKKRLQGIGSINKMTKAMELVAATKMRRAQEAALASRPWALSALEILANLLQSLEEPETQKLDLSKFPLLAPRKVKKTAVLLIAADKGLAGSFNSAVFKKFEKFLERNRDEVADDEITYLAVGQKAVDYLKRRGFPAEAQFTRFGDIIQLSEVEPLATVLHEGYASQRWDRLIVFSTNFRSALKQDVIERQLLPLSFEKIREIVAEIIPETGRFAQLRSQILEDRPAEPVQYVIEPSPAEALQRLLPLLFTMQLYHLILEANASEHSARRMAMKNATDNASELIEDLTLLYNRTRQAVITKEITEITGTTAALNK